MKKTLVLTCCLVAVLALVIAVFLGSHQTASTVAPIVESDVVIPMSASRPGCEKTNWCYTPSEITVSSGKTITWLNDDSGLHTVTSGYYDKPDGMFDSGHIDSGQTFSYKFEKLGDFHYYCNLHPWMEGKVIVK
jgi:plastocyanin